MIINDPNSHPKFACEVLAAHPMGNGVLLHLMLTGPKQDPADG